MAKTYSVIIPTLNEEKFLPNLLESLIVQTDKHFEVIVVDGSSKDKTVAIAKSFASKLPKLNVIVSEKACLPLQRNLGAREAKGQWFVFVDADSVLFPHFIERITRFIQEKNPALFTTWIRPDTDTPGDANIALLGNLVFEMALSLHRPLPSGPMTAVTREAFDAVGGYNEGHSFNEDVDFCMRVMKAHFPVDVIPETLYVWSLRRLRHQGTLKVIQRYILSALPVLFFNRPLKSMPGGYIMGGQPYNKTKKKISQTNVRRYQRRLKKLLKELFE
jgi:glycosyltransferase involved in cell wall biosynthesis